MSVVLSSRRANSPYVKRRAGLRQDGVTALHSRVLSPQGLELAAAERRERHAQLPVAGPHRETEQRLADRLPHVRDGIGGHVCEADAAPGQRAAPSTEG